MITKVKENTHFKLSDGKIVIIEQEENTYVLIKSIVCALSWSALWRSAKIKVSAAVSTDKFMHNASSHMTFSFSNAY